MKNLSSIKSDQKNDAIQHMDNNTHWADYLKPD